MSRPKISVAMCSYNGVKYIQEQLRSILEQTHPPHELVICDDNSEDDTAALISELTESTNFPVKLFVQKNNVGIIENFSTAIAMCSGDYIALADQDDIWSPEKLEVLGREIGDYRDQKPLFIYSDLCLINSQGQSLHKRLSETVRADRHDEKPWLTLASRNFIPGCSSLFDRRSVQKILPIPREAILHDWWIALFFSLHGTMRYVEKELISYRVHDGNSRGLSSYRRTAQLIARFGFSNIASNNFLMTLRQLQAARDRLYTYDLPAPKALTNFCDIDCKPRLARPWVLFRLGVRRVSSLISCMLITKGKSCDDSVGYL